MLLQKHRYKFKEHSREGKRTLEEYSKKKKKKKKKRHSRREEVVILSTGL
jgi:hypothetical protein